MAQNQRQLKVVRQAQREEALRRQRRHERRNLAVIVAALVVVGLIIAGVALYFNHAAQQNAGSRLSFVAQPATIGQQIADEGSASHIDSSQTPTYRFYPPTSGQHWGQPYGPAGWTTVGPLVEGTFVHDLEHGGIVIAYNCPTGSDCVTLKNQLQNYVQHRAPLEPQFSEVKIVMTPYTRGMTHKIALLAWHWIDWLDSYNESEITHFYESHVNQAPEQIP
jgi:Protein of unknown function (DUF3105)